MTVRTEVETKLSAWAKSQTPAIPVSFEGIKFTKPTNGPYLEIVFLGDNSINRNVDASGERTYGMFQINCFAPVGVGMAQVEALADNVKSLYPVLPKTGTVSIETPLNTSGSYVEDNFVCIPVRARYRTES